MFEHCFDVVTVRGQGRLSSHASLVSCIKEYLGGQRWQFVRCAEMTAGLYAIRGGEMAHERLGPVTGG